MFTNADNTVAKITDFGFAKLVMDHERMFSTCGTLHYMPPEILAHDRQGYGIACDMWSAGVVLYCLLSGTEPFYEEDPTREILSGE